MITAASVGCLVDGHAGQYGPRLVIELAQEHGFQMSEEDSLRVRFMYDPECDLATRDDCSEHVLSQGGILDTAEQWLNDEVAPGGTHFGWYDGEFFLQTNDWWEDEGDPPHDWTPTHNEEI